MHDSVDSDSFANYLFALSDLHKNKKIAVFVDNLQVHHTADVKAVCESLDIFVIYNKTYSPDFNPIEFVFSQVKNHYKRARFNYENKSQSYDMAHLI